MKRNEIIVLCIATALLLLGFVVLGLFGVLELSNKIDTSQLIQIIITFVLVLVTVAYVKRTADIASATRKQAEEMEKQRIEQARPYLLLKLEDGSIPWNPSTNLPDVEKLNGFIFRVRILNAGKEPATNLESAYYSHGKRPLFWNYGGNPEYLLSDKECIAQINAAPAGESINDANMWLSELHELLSEEPTLGLVAVKYEDIRRTRRWVTYFCLESPVNDASIAIEGEQNIVELEKNDS